MDRPADQSASRPRVAVLAPMPSELKPLRALASLERSEALGAGLFSGGLGRCDVVAAIAGVGLQAAARCTERLLDATAPDHLLVMGIAGAIGPDARVGGLVVPEYVEQLATGERFAPARLGDLPRRGILASSDALLTSPEAARRLARRGIVAIDMETAAVAAVCERRGCPWSVFRGLSDRADDGTTDSAVLGLLDADGRPNARAVARFVLARPHRTGQLVRLARGASTAARVAAQATAAAIGSL